MAAPGQGAAVVPAGEGYPERWGEGVPWGDPSWYRGYKSPYYKPTHHAWRAKVRADVASCRHDGC